MNNAEDMIEKMVNLLNTKRQKLLDILEITKRQTLAINNKEDESLDKYIDDKQAIINDIDDIDKQFIECLNILKSQLGIKSLDETPKDKLEEFKLLKTCINENHTIIEEIISIEKENSVKLKAEFDDIKEKIKEISGGKRIVSAYENRPVYNDGAFFDKKK